MLGVGERVFLRIGKCQGFESWSVNCWSRYTVKYCSVLTGRSTDENREVKHSGTTTTTITGLDVKYGLSQVQWFAVQ